MSNNIDDYLTIEDGETLNVCLYRPGGAAVDYDWVVDYEGPVTFVVADLPEVKRGSQARPAGHKAISIVRPDGQSWAEYVTNTDFQPTTGVLLCEDYMLELVR